jgi:thiamine-phosphate pyrophosphorylase
MTDVSPRLYLMTPVVSDADAFAPALSAACSVGNIAAICLRLAPADERTQINRIKILAPIAQERGAAVLLTNEGDTDWPMVVMRGGADGVHAMQPDTATLTDLRARLNDGRILGAGNLRARHDAMEAGEAGVDYVLFGEPGEDGILPPLSAVIERAQWWSEIFETPCVAHSPDLDALGAIAATGTDFIGLGDTIWTAPEGPAAAISGVLNAIAKTRAKTSAKTTRTRPLPA